MNSLQVKACMDVLLRGHVNITFNVIPADELNNVIKNVKSKFIYIVNKDPSYLSGSHFIVVAHLILHTYEVYDSLGVNVNMYDKTFFSKLQKLHPNQNLTIHQPDYSYLCGGYCLRYIYFRLHGFSIQRTLSTFYIHKNKNEMIVKCFLKCKFKRILNGLKYMNEHVKCRCVQSVLSPCQQK